MSDDPDSDEPSLAEWFSEPIPRTNPALLWALAIVGTVAAYVFSPDGMWVVMAGLLLAYPLVVMVLVLAMTVGGLR